MTNREKAIELVQESHQLELGDEDDIRASTLHNVNTKNLIDNLEILLNEVDRESFQAGFNRGLTELGAN